MKQLKLTITAASDIAKAQLSSLWRQQEPTNQDQQIYWVVTQTACLNSVYLACNGFWLWICLAGQLPFCHCLCHRALFGFSVYVTCNMLSGPWTCQYDCCYTKLQKVIIITHSEGVRYTSQTTQHAAKLYAEQDSCMPQQRTVKLYNNDQRQI